MPVEPFFAKWDDAWGWWRVDEPEATHRFDGKTYVPYTPPGGMAPTATPPAKPQPFNLASVGLGSMGVGQVPCP